MKALSIMAIVMLLVSMFAFSFASAQFEATANVAKKAKVAESFDSESELSAAVGSNPFVIQEDEQTILIDFLGVTERSYRVKGLLTVTSSGTPDKMTTSVNGKVVISSPTGVIEYMVEGINPTSADGATYKMRVVASAENGNAPEFVEGVFKINFAEDFGMLITSSEEYNFKVKDAHRSIVREDNSATVSGKVALDSSVETQDKISGNSEISAKADAEVETASEGALGTSEDSESSGESSGFVNWIKRVFSFLF